jgi:hypothetical protein
MMAVQSDLRHVVQQLQADPRRYKLFGVYWWLVKAMLRRAGYGPAQLYMLGSYIDSQQAREVASWLRGMGYEDALHHAFGEYQVNAAFPHADGRVENPDGELVPIFDADAGL